MSSGESLPADGIEPLEELVLELDDLRFDDHGGSPRASARARLLHTSTTSGKREVNSETAWRFIEPIGPIERNEIHWYLEKYAVWPSTVFRDRAKKVEERLVQWGRLLHDETMRWDLARDVLVAWHSIDAHANRRFSIEVDATLVHGASEADVVAVRECATILLGLPWELLHDGRSYLFQGAKPVLVRRRVPNTRAMDRAVVDTPIRILLVTARPEDEACSYIDHRASALPLIDAMEALGGSVQIHLLDPPTLPAMRDELDRARRNREPYHVVHFDGHGVYDRHAGLGALCFEKPEDSGRLANRGHVLVTTETLGPLLEDHRIPVVFLEACQTATSEKASESVASELLKVGVASVVAMSHSVLIETSRRFVEKFYDTLAAGQRVGEAMLAGQRALKDDTYRGRIFGVGELRLEDWFVPVLFQEVDDPQLFRAMPDRQAQDDLKTALASRLGALPPPPQTGFIGRSRELLALQRLLRQEQNGRYAVIRGQGGEGKTALAVESARWMVRSQQIERAAFVSVEMHSSAVTVLDEIGRQLVGGYSVATFSSLDEAISTVERALVAQSTLLVIDNMESVLAPPFVETAEALSEDARAELEKILALCARLNERGETRIVFTSREPLPAPFDRERNRRELHQLDREDAVRLIEGVLNEAGDGDGVSDAAREAIEELVDAVNGHARTLTLLAPSLRAQGVEATHASLVALMEEMHRRFPESREQSLFASVELSLQRLSPANRERARVLAVFHGGVNLVMLRAMTQWEEADVVSLAVELVGTGLATPNRYNHLTLNPALSPYLRAQLAEEERETLTAQWADEMGGYARFLRQQQSGRIEIASTLTLLELPNLFALLERVENGDDVEATIALATTLHSLLQGLGKPRLLDRIATARDAAEARLGEGWNHARFEARRIRIEQQLQRGQLREAMEGAEELLRRALAAGETSYPGADYDLAGSHWLLGRVLRMAGDSDQALPLLGEAQRRFEAIEQRRRGRGGPMASACITERGDCLLDLGRFDEAAAAYEEGIRRDTERGAERDVAVGNGQLGSVRLRQGRYAEALEKYAEARARFTQLDEPGGVAVFWHQAGMVHEAAGEPEAAEDAYRHSLELEVRLGNVAGQASTLGQLGNLYDAVLGRREEAVAFYRQAADKYVALHDAANVGRARSNLADTLRKLGRLDEARQEAERAIDCKEPFGHAAEIWKTWNILSGIETAAGNPAAAADARRKAVDAYLAYRRDGGENHYDDGRLALAVTQALAAGDASAAASFLAQIAADPRIAEPLRPFVHALQAIVAGSRDRSLAGDLFFTMAAEILLLIETLERPA